MYFQLSQKAEKPVGCATLEMLNYESYDSLHNDVKNVVANVNDAPVDKVIIQKMIFYPGRRSIQIKRTSDVIQAKMEKEPKLGVKFGKYQQMKLSYSLQWRNYGERHERPIYQRCPSHSRF